MALIPPDAAIRMRMDMEAGLLQPVRPVREIPADLPELRPGQRFTARIQEELPDNLYKALVAGKALTLQLPEGAKNGDLLELVVIDRSPRVLIAQRVDVTSPALAEGAGEPYPYSTFSRAAQMIGQLLLPEGETPHPALLNRGQPLLAQPPADPAKAALLAPTLAKATSQSGLFYEAHQAHWIAGKLPIEQLMLEPQGRQMPPRLAHAHTAPPAAPASQPATAPPAQQTLIGGEGRPAEVSAETRTASLLAQAVPEPLRPLVQQQLDALATQRLVWHGEVWPGQVMQWEIGREDIHDREGTDAGEAERWSTTLRLTLPRLGEVDAMLQLAAGGVRIRLAAAGDATDDLRNAGPRLGDAIEAAGLKLIGLEIRHES
ncbi:MAG: flagellar hook-length control protein FliK [Candidatus Nitricoxidivorans perseverans]|uniref:Flagellar hook-length control protein FliK n=1 Tax=Candidatus Nitricoxidivorans perseverans TaxID=2975601 RepID=A0AA49FNC6_9PROT|nr:MAG: flagellar hook-length control protein FliK [Candidatus Nitricoxidivorans perseverans]